jgi:hypothetical protein
MAHTIQDMSELEAARSILEDVRILIEVLPSEVLTNRLSSSRITSYAAVGTLLDNIEEAAERIIDLNYE